MDMDPMGFAGCFPPAGSLSSLLVQLCRRRGVGRVFYAGHSLLGRPLPVLALGSAGSPVLMVGGVHGGEYLTAILLLRFAAELLDRLAAEKSLCGIALRPALERRGLLILPCLNPDGAEIARRGPAAAGFCRPLVQGLWQEGCLWQANARGVDLNHNFDAGWSLLRAMEQERGILGPAPGGYGGSRPHSEPESRAAVRLCLRQNVSVLYAFHSQGEELYWHYGSRTPPAAALMAELLADCCGYRTACPEGTAAHGGLKDWFIAQTGRPGFTFEVGRGKNPLPDARLEEIYTKLREALAAALVL